MSLVIRNQELGGVVGASVNTVMRATAAILTPVVLSRFVSSPKAINKLLKLKTVDLRTPKAQDRALVIINEAIEAIEDPDTREEVRNEVKNSKLQKQKSPKPIKEWGFFLPRIYRLQIYIVTSKPKRISLYSGLDHIIVIPFVLVLNYTVVIIPQIL